MSRVFNKTEEDYIRNNYTIMTDEEIAEVLGNDHSANQVVYWRMSHNYKKRYRAKSWFNDKTIDFIKNNYLKMTYTEMESVLHIPKKVLRTKACQLGLRKNRKFNNNYFDNIDTPLKAYFLGFIFADGWVISNTQQRNYEFGMQLQSSDKYILDKLNQELGGIHLITHKNPHITSIKGVEAHCGHSDVLRIFSAPLVRSLVKQGVVPNKTKQKLFPKMENCYFFDWLRGYIDGDGCYSCGMIHITSSFDDVLYYIQNILNKWNIKSSIYQELEHKYRLCIYDKESIIKLVNLLYYDDKVFCLSRKKEKIQQYLNGSSIQ